MNDKKRRTGASLGVYVALGAAVGAAVGFVADPDDFALWLAVGVAIGLAVGSDSERRRS